MFEEEITHRTPKPEELLRSSKKHALERQEEILVANIADIERQLKYPQKLTFRGKERLVKRLDTYRIQLKGLLDDK